MPFVTTIHLCCNKFGTRIFQSQVNLKSSTIYDPCSSIASTNLSFIYFNLGLTKPRGIGFFGFGDSCFTMNVGLDLVLSLLKPFSTNNWMLLDHEFLRGKICQCLIFFKIMTKLKLGILKGLLILKLWVR